MNRPHPHALEDRYRRNAERLFGVRSDNFKVAEEMPARLLAGELLKQGHDLDSAVLAACDVFPDADSGKVRTMLEDSLK